MDVKKSNTQPNIILILADDLGFSDVGCFGSEISTPHIDSLASSGLRFTQMYNCARCCPSRASLLTGMYPHQAGIGHMVYDAGVGPEYQGYLREDVVTIGELMKSGGYKTFMCGKWHVGGEYPPDASYVSKDKHFITSSTHCQLIISILKLGMDTKNNGRCNTSNTHTARI
jgi:arylsulfatase A-like enzyme